MLSGSLSAWALHARSRIGRAALADLSLLLPPIAALAFFIWAWRAGGGLPIFLDSNETYLSFVHARDMQLWDPRTFAFLTVQTTDPARSTLDVYTHNPNFPRYVHYALLLLGVTQLSQHVLIIGLLAIPLAFWLVYQVLAPAGARQPFIARLLAATMAVDYVGFLAFTGNTYRIFTFLLFWGCVAAVARPWPVWTAALLAFALYQFEYGFALFVTVTCGSLALLLGWRPRWRTLAAAAIGAGASLVLFGFQVAKFLGRQGLLVELQAAYSHRGPGSDTPLGLGLVSRIPDGFQRSFETLGSFYNPVIQVVVLWAVVSSVVVVLRGRGTSRLFLARLLLAMCLGAGATAGVLFGYYVAAYHWSTLPFLTLFVSVSATIAALDLLTTMALFWRREALPAAVVCATLVLLPIAVNSVQKFHPPFNGDALRVLADEFAGQSFVATDQHLTFALTGGRVMGGSRTTLARHNLAALDAMRGPDQMLYFECLDLNPPPEALRVGPQGDGCRQLTEPRLAEGHEIVRAGPGYTILAVKPASELVPLTPAQREATQQRDAVRKADLERLRALLLAYRQEHGRFPCPGINTWVASTEGPDWIPDRPTACGVAGPAAPLPGPLPIDPVNELGEPWDGALNYQYRVYRRGCPTATHGTYFILTAVLEAPTEPDPAHEPRDCTGERIPWPDAVWAISTVEP